MRRDKAPKAEETVYRGPRQEGGFISRHYPGFWGRFKIWGALGPAGSLSLVGEEAAPGHRKSQALGGKWKSALELKAGPLLLAGGVRRPVT